jgi:hypothetical protein
VGPEADGLVRGPVPKLLRTPGLGREVRNSLCSSLSMSLDTTVTYVCVCIHATMEHVRALGTSVPRMTNTRMEQALDFGGRLFRHRCREYSRDILLRPCEPERTNEYDTCRSQLRHGTARIHRLTEAEPQNIGSCCVRFTRRFR